MRVFEIIELLSTFASTRKKMQVLKIYDAKLLELINFVPFDIIVCSMIFSITFHLSSVIKNSKEYRDIFLSCSLSMIILKLCANRPSQNSVIRIY